MVSSLVSLNSLLKPFEFILGKGEFNNFVDRLLPFLIPLPAPLRGHFLYPQLLHVVIECPLRYRETHDEKERNTFLSLWNCAFSGRKTDFSSELLAQLATFRA